MCLVWKVQQIFYHSLWRAIIGSTMEKAQKIWNVMNVHTYLDKCSCNKKCWYFPSGLISTDCLETAGVGDHRGGGRGSSQFGEILHQESMLLHVFFSRSMAMIHQRRSIVQLVTAVYFQSMIMTSAILRSSIRGVAYCTETRHCLETLFSQW